MLNSTFFILNSNGHEISTATLNAEKKKTFALKLSSVVFIMQINVKMPTIVGILICMKRVWRPSLIQSSFDCSFFILKGRLIHFLIAFDV